MGKGKPTGITHQDINARDAPGVAYIMFERERVAVLDYDPKSYPEILELGRVGPDLRLYGHLEDGEFMEEDREFIPCTVEEAATYLGKTDEEVEQLVDEELIKKVPRKGLIRRIRESRLIRLIRRIRVIKQKKSDGELRLLSASSVERWKEVQKARGYIGFDDSRKEAARLDYQQTLLTYRMLADIRFKLLAFIPVVSGIVITLLSRDVTSLGYSPQITIVIGVLGFVVTLALAIYDQRNSQIHDETVGRARFLEDVVQFSSRKGRRGHISQRPDNERRLFYLVSMWHDRALALIYGAVLGAWIFPIAYAILVLWEYYPNLLWEGFPAFGLSKDAVAGSLAAFIAIVFIIEFHLLDKR